MRAVHWFQEVLFTFFRRMDRLKCILAIFCIVTGSHIQQFITNRRSNHFLIIVAGLNTTQEFLQTQTQCSTFRQPHRESLSNRFREHEQLHLLTNLTVVTLLRFFQQYQIFIQHFLFRERNTINTGQHLAIFVTTPVSTGNSSQLDSLDRSSRHQVRATAKVSKCTLCIRSNVSVLQFGNQFTFISFPTIAEHLQSICFSNALSDYIFFLCSQFQHFSFNSGQITFFNHSFSRIHIIVESVFNSRTDTKLDTRIKFLQSFSQQVGTCMPKGMFTFFIIPFIKYEIRILINRTSQIVSLTIHATCQHILRQTRTDTFCNL